ncbi:MAG: vitamin K epoxide reductase family protein [Patescibacteria group bacterium]
MKILKTLLNNQSIIISNLVIIFFAIVSLVGVVDTVFVTINHYKGVIPPCTLLNGCETVLTSKYSEVFGVPIALIGALFYSTVFLFSLAYLKTKNNKIIIVFLALTALAFLMSLFFIYLQFFVIKAVCEYCLISAAASTILFVTSVFMARRVVASDSSV